MKHPRHEILEARSEMSRVRIAGIVFVALLHVVLIYAIASGLAMKFVKALPAELNAQVIQPQQEEHQPPPPKPALQLPNLPAIPPPQINVQQQQTQSPPITVQTTTAPAGPANNSPVATQAKGITSTHSIPPYPETSRRLGKQGTVVLKVMIDADGSVTDAQVEQSSGVQDLDTAAVEWVKSHWKYKPATGTSGQPIASVSEAAVKFDLKQAG